MLKRAQVEMLPTKQKSNLIIGSKGTLTFFKEKYLSTENCRAQHFYFLSDEKPKEGNWCIDLYTKTIFLKRKELSHYERNCNGIVKKIIATTDESLLIETYYEVEGNQKIKLPQPSKSFIEKYITEYNKGNIIKEVMIEFEEYHGINTSLTEISSYSNSPIDYGKDYKLKVNKKDNTITIRPIKTNWNKEELQKLFDSYGDNIQAKIIWNDIQNL